jgi:hypothetical protein
MDWGQIASSFRGSFEGAMWGFVLFLLVAFLSPIVWHLVSRRFKHRRDLSGLQRRLRAKGITPQEWGLLEGAIRDTCPDDPQRLLDNVSLFHGWVDGLPDLDKSPGLLASLSHIKEITYPDSHHVFVPHSTRDLVMGASLNMVLHKGGQEAMPCIVTEVTMESLRLSTRGSQPIHVRSGEQISLFYARPEAMYHALVTVQSAAGGECRTAHSAKGQFKVRQLREFWRVDVDMEMDFMLIQDPTDPLALEGNPERRPGRLINLSGNGAAIVTPHAPARGTHIAFTLHLPSKTLHNIRAEVLHITPSRDKSRLHLVFRNLDPGDQELIIRNLFLLYREQAGMEPLAESGATVVQTRY